MKRRVREPRRIPVAKELRRALRRRWAIRLTLLAILIAVCLADHRGWLLHAGEWRQYHKRDFNVVAVIDGDTIDVVSPGGGKPIRVRLWGIDTPETAKPFLDEPRPAEPLADEAMALTRRLCLGRTVRLYLERHELRGKYGRLLAHVELPDGSVLNECLLVAGLARFESRFDHSRFNRYELLEQQARYDRLGLWSAK